MDKSIIIAFLGNAKYDARCLNMAYSLANNNFKVVLIDELSNKGNLNSSQFESYHVDTIQKTGIKRYWNYHCRVQGITRRVNPDIFISADLFSLAICSKLTSSSLKIFDCRELYTNLASLVNQPLKQFFWSLYERIYYKNMDKVLVTANSDKAFLLSKYGNKDIQIIYNFPKSSQMTHHINIKEKYDISENMKIFIYQGAIQVGRGIDEMISLLKDFKDCVALIVGEGKYKSDLEKLSRELKVENRVIYTGVIPYIELLNITKQADIGFSLIQPISKSYMQALPNKLFEYGLAGVPTIASNFPEMKKYIEQYNLGIVVNPINSENQIEAVKSLLNWSDRNQLIQTVSNNFTWEAQEINFLALMKNK